MCMYETYTYSKKANNDTVESFFSGFTQPYCVAAKRQIKVDGNCVIMFGSIRMVYLVGK